MCFIFRLTKVSLNSATSKSPSFIEYGSRIGPRVQFVPVAVMAFPSDSRTTASPTANTFFRRRKLFPNRSKDVRTLRTGGFQSSLRDKISLAEERSYLTV